MTPDPSASDPVPSQRTLAAIVFTDVVSFSARMHTDEVGTIKLLNRDFAEMRRLCAAHEGAVLKTTGDGLLLTFTSAVQAVACALAMQRQFAAEAKSLGSGEPLQHRIGIHLGDVLVHDKDVMGDGVNIASRLQAEAEPGGICISQTVYDVVRNKLEMKVLSLGARDLKNISHAMPIYHLVLEAQALDSSGRAGPPAGQAAVSRGRRKLWLVAGAGVALVLVAVMGWKFAHRSQVSLPAAAGSPPANPPPAARAGAPPAAGTKPAGESELAGEMESEFAKRQDLMRKLHTLYLDKYDFNGLVLALRDKGESPSASPALQQLLRSAEQMVKMKSWLEFDLRRYNRQHPLVVHDLSGDPAKDASIYLADDLRVVYLESGNSRSSDLTAIKPAALGAIIVSAIHEGTQVQRAALMGAKAFARLYTLPAMTEALAPNKDRRAKDAAPN